MTVVQRNAWPLRLANLVGAMAISCFAISCGGGDSTSGNSNSFSVFAPGISTTASITSAKSGGGANLGDGAISTETIPQLSGTLSAPLAAGEELAVVSGSTVLGRATVTGTKWAFAPSSALASGSYGVSVAVVRSDGREGPRSAPLSFNVIQIYAQASSSSTSGSDNYSFWISGANSRVRTVVWSFGGGILDQAVGVYNGSSAPVVQSLPTNDSRVIGIVFKDGTGATVGASTTTINAAAQPTPMMTISGTVATGAAVVGATVSASCQMGKSYSSQPTNALGSYSVSVSTAALPCTMSTMLQSGETIRSFALGSPIANVTPLTELVVRRAASDPANFKKGTDESLTLLQTMKVPFSGDPTTTSFLPNGTGNDAAIEKLFTPFLTTTANSVSTKLFTSNLSEYERIDPTLYPAVMPDDKATFLL